MSARLPVVIDLSLGQFIRQQRAERERAELRRPQTGEQALIEEFSYTTDAACLLRADVQLPPDLYAFIDALIGVSGGSTEWFPATDARVARRAGRCTKWVQRRRDDLNKWQREARVGLVEIEDHYTDGERKRHPHKYRVHLHRLAVAIKLDAKASAKWSQSPAYALSAAMRRMRDSIPDWTPRKTRGRKREPSAEALINASLKAAATQLKKASDSLRSVELQKLTHGYHTAPAIDPERLAEFFAAVGEFKTLLYGQEPAETTRPAETDLLVDKVSTRDFIDRKCIFDPDPPSDVPSERPSEAALTISDADREQYELELCESAGRRMDAGASKAEADREALQEIGDVATWRRRVISL